MGSPSRTSSTITSALHSRSAEAIGTHARRHAGSASHSRPAETNETHEPRRRALAEQAAQNGRPLQTKLSSAPEQQPSDDATHERWRRALAEQAAAIVALYSELSSAREEQRRDAEAMHALRREVALDRAAQAEGRLAAERAVFVDDEETSRALEQAMADKTILVSALRRLTADMALAKVEAHRHAQTARRVVGTGRIDTLGSPDVLLSHAADGDV